MRTQIIAHILGHYWQQGWELDELVWQYKRMLSLPTAQLLEEHRLRKLTNVYLLPRSLEWLAYLREVKLWKLARVEDLTRW